MHNHPYFFHSITLLCSSFRLGLDREVVTDHSLNASLCILIRHNISMSWRRRCALLLPSMLWESFLFIKLFLPCAVRCEPRRTLISFRIQTQLYVVRKKNKATRKIVYSFACELPFGYLEYLPRIDNACLTKCMLSKCNWIPVHAWASRPGHMSSVRINWIALLKMFSRLSRIIVLEQIAWIWALFLGIFS